MLFISLLDNRTPGIRGFAENSLIKIMAIRYNVHGTVVFFVRALNFSSCLPIRVLAASKWMSEPESQIVSALNNESLNLLACLV